jgi:hypothetical protein
MPCTEMKELEAACTMFGERRHVALPPTSERRKMLADWLQARAVCYAITPPQLPYMPLR